MRPDLRGAATAPTLLVATDYDGTLAPIVNDPAAAYPDPDALTALRDLAGLPETHLAIISGRSRAGLERLLGPLPGALLVGGHGGEWGDGEASAEAADLAARLQDIAELFPGALVEPKPTGAAFHYRHVDTAEAEEAAGAATAAVTGLATRVVHGKRVVDFSTSHADKGTALRRLREQLSPDVIVFIGDDITDEDAFAALDPSDVGIKVGGGDTVARWRLANQADVSSVLEELAALRDPRPR